MPSHLAFPAVEDSGMVHKDMGLAAGMAFGEFLLAFWWAPIHRIYLGSSTGAYIGYFLTCGGCGVLPIVDGFLLLTSKNPERFINNPKLIMW